MKSMYMNYFKEGKLYQWDINKEVYLLSDTNIKEEFCLDKSGMDTFLKFENPEIVVGGTLTIKSGRVKANIKLRDEVLSFPNLDFTTSFKIDVDKIKVASKFVAKQGTGRVILTGINIKNGYIAATDSFSLYRTKCESDCNLTIASSFIKAIAMLSGEIEFKANDNIISCENEGITYIGRIYADTYPELSSLFQEIKSNKIVINKSELKEFLAYATDKSSYVILSKNKLSINSTASVKNSDFEIDLELPIEEPICVSFEKLESIINCINEDEIVIEYETPRKPILFNKDFLMCPCTINEG